MDNLASNLLKLTQFVCISILLLSLVSCRGEPEITAAKISPKLDEVPELNTALHEVPLEKIFFDTFRPSNRLVPYTKAEAKFIKNLRDQIPPLYNPEFESVDSAQSWLKDTDRVVGYADGNESFAYPFRIMTWHEIVIQQVGGRPIMVTF